MDIKNLTTDQALEQYDSFEMFSKSGDRACKTLVKKVFKKIEGKYRITQDDITQMIVEGCKKIYQKHPEVHDTEPGWHIQELVNKKLQEIGYCFVVSRYDF
jgi:hypothetical protein